MIQSKLSKWVFYRVTAYAIFFLIISMPAYIEEVDKNRNNIIWADFFETVGVVITCTTAIFLITLLQKKRVLILEKMIVLGNYLTPTKREIVFSEIKGMTWMKKNMFYRSLRGMSTSVNLQEFSIYFKDLSTLNIAKKDYDNYDELANWFFNYCRKNEIIKIDPLEVRKRSRYKRPERVKKL